MLASAVTLSLFSRRSPLIAHRRVGWRGSALWMLKLRTMWDHEDAGAGRRSGWIEYIDDDPGPRLKQADDPRVNNRFARFCRHHSIDELPQLWHVIRGEMSLVGPRPMTAGELRRHYQSDAAEILEVKPGIAGLWQVSGRNQLSYMERRQLDLKLVRQRSIRMYLEILARALPEVWSGQNAW
jgi:exopolysaccharide production protein ExoY